MSLQSRKSFSYRSAADRRNGFRMMKNRTQAVLQKETDKIALETTKKKILLLYDVEGWAFHNICLQYESCIRKHFPEWTAVLYPYPEFIQKFHGCHDKTLSETALNFLSSIDFVLCMWYGSFRNILECFSQFEAKPKSAVCIYDYTKWTEPGLYQNILKSAILTADFVLTSCSAIDEHVKKCFADEWESRKTIFYSCADGVDTELFTKSDFDSNRHIKTDLPLRVVWTGSSKHFYDVKRMHLLKRLREEKLPWLHVTLQDAKYQKRSHSEMPAVYHNSDVTVCVSKSEGTPNMVLEGAACGLPFVATAVGIIPMLIRDAHTYNLPTPGLVLTKENDEDIYEELKACLLRLHENRTLLSKMGNSAHELVVKHGWNFQEKLKLLLTVLLV